MTIELALGGLSYSMFCALLSLLIVGLSMLIGTAMVYLFIKSLSYILKLMKGGVENLKETAKELTKATTTNYTI